MDKRVWRTQGKILHAGAMDKRVWRVADNDLKFLPRARQTRLSMPPAVYDVALTRASLTFGDGADNSSHGTNKNGLSL